MSILKNSVRTHLGSLQIFSSFKKISKIKTLSKPTHHSCHLQKSESSSFNIFQKLKLFQLTISPAFWLRFSLLAMAWEMRSARLDMIGFWGMKIKKSKICELLKSGGTLGEGGSNDCQTCWLYTIPLSMTLHSITHLSKEQCPSFCILTLHSITHLSKRTMPIKPLSDLCHVGQWALSHHCCAPELPTWPEKFIVAQSIVP
jgi:hypothetical protein